MTDPKAEIIQLEVSHLTKSFGSHKAVDNLSFSIKRGEFYTLLGPSGCGKSTTLMMIAGLEHPDSGSIRLRGNLVTGVPPEKRKIGVVFQNYALFPHMSILDNVAFGLRMRGESRRVAREEAREMLNLVELRHPERFPAQISGGQMQRVALARALVFHPDLLLMDEPLSALDRRLRQSMQFALRRLQLKLHATVLYVTHDQEEALVLSDRMAVMRDGRIDQVATPQDIYKHPANAFVARFLGESNHMPVQVTERNGDWTKVTAGGLERRTIVVPSRHNLAESGVLVVRPEDISLSGTDIEHDSSDKVNMCLATVEDVSFLGAHIRVSLALDGGETWTAHLSNHIDNAPAVGVRVGVTWRPEDSHLLDTV